MRRHEAQQAPRRTPPAPGRVDTAEAGTGFEATCGPETFAEFYQREFPQLTLVARALVGAEQAEDIAQESMLVAYRRWRSIGSMSSPGGYVRGICLHKATSVLRRRTLEQRTWVRLVGRQVPTATEDELSDDSNQFWSQIRSLPHRQAQVAALHYALDMSIADISTVLNCAEGTVKVHLHRARLTLAEALAGPPGTPKEALP